MRDESGVGFKDYGFSTRVGAPKGELSCESRPLCSVSFSSGDKPARQPHLAECGRPLFFRFSAGLLREWSMTRSSHWSQDESMLFFGSEPKGYT